MKVVLERDFEGHSSWIYLSFSPVCRVKLLQSHPIVLRGRLLQLFNLPKGNELKLDCTQGNFIPLRKDTYHADQIFEFVSLGCFGDGGQNGSSGSTWPPWTFILVSLVLTSAAKYHSYHGGGEYMAVRQAQRLNVPTSSLHPSRHPRFRLLRPSRHPKFRLLQPGTPDPPIRNKLSTIRLTWGGSIYAKCGSTSLIYFDFDASNILALEKYGRRNPPHCGFQLSPRICPRFRQAATQSEFKTTQCDGRVVSLI